LADCWIRAFLARDLVRAYLQRLLHPELAAAAGLVIHSAASSLSLRTTITRLQAGQFSRNTVSEVLIEAEQ